MEDKLKFSMTAEEAAAKRKATRIQILQGEADCFAKKNPTLLSGELAYERNTGKIKIGDGITPWNNLPYKADQALTSEMVAIIKNAEIAMNSKGQPNGCATLDPQGKILKSQLPADIKSTTVLRTIKEMDNIPASEKYEGQVVFVLDASDDDTVGSGAATYIWTGSSWEKISEAESVDIDQSVFFLKEKDTLDNILPGDKNIHFSKELKDKLDSIEAGATGDLTTPEIAGMYESIKGVNRFTDELKKKLDGIEAGATQDTPAELREKLQQLSGSLRLSADSIQPGDVNKFFTEKERQEIDNILAKLDKIEEGATSDTAEQLRDKLQSLAGNKMLSADFIADGSVHKFLTPAQVESLKLIEKLNNEISTIQNQIANLDSNKADKKATEEKIAALLVKLENYKSDISKIINEKFVKVQSDLGTNTANIGNLNNDMEGLKTQLANLNNAIAKGVSSDKITEILTIIENYKNDINKTLNQRVGKVENNLGINTANIGNLNNDIEGLKAQLANLNNAVSQGLSSDKITEIVSSIEKYKNDINKTLNDRVGKLENDLRGNTVNIGNLDQDIDGLRAQFLKLNSDVANKVGAKELSDILSQLDKYRSDLNKTLNERFGKVENNLGINTADIGNLGNDIDGIKDQLSKINIPELKAACEENCNDLITKLENYKTEINKTIDNRISKLETNFGDINFNLKSEFTTLIDQKIADKLTKLEAALKSQIETLKTFITPEQIKALYESNPDTNVFTNAEQSKLAGIEPNANVTDYNTVKNAGAIMEGDILFGGDCATMF